MKFTSAVSNLKIDKTTINFKISITKIQKSSVSLHFLKNNFRIIKEVSREHSSEFQ